LLSVFKTHTSVFKIDASGNLRFNVDDTLLVEEKLQLEKFFCELYAYLVWCDRVIAKWDSFPENFDTVFSRFEEELENLNLKVHTARIPTPAPTPNPTDMEIEARKKLSDMGIETRKKLLAAMLPLRNEFKNINIETLRLKVNSLPIAAKASSINGKVVFNAYESAKSNIKQMSESELDTRLKALGEDVNENIKAIVEICNDSYSNQYYSGNDALNRGILLDAKIKNLLTPAVMQAIMIKSQLCKLRTVEMSKDVDIAIVRFRGPRHTEPYFSSFADTMYYALCANQNLESLELIALNVAENLKVERSLKEHLRQRDKFVNNALPMLSNIQEAAKGFGAVVPSVPKVVKGANYLDELFVNVRGMIEQVKSAEKVDVLLEVAAYKPKTICSQASRGLSDLLGLIPIDPKEIDFTITIDDIYKKIATSPALLDNQVAHIFYDRLHLEAILAMDGNIIINAREITYQGLIAGLVQHISKHRDDPDYQIAVQQFEIRLELVQNHMLANKDKLGITKTVQVDTEAKPVNADGALLTAFLTAKTAAAQQKTVVDEEAVKQEAVIKSKNYSYI